MCASIDRTFYIFSVAQNVRMIHAKNYEKMSKSVKVTAKMLSVLFLFGHAVHSFYKQRVVSLEWMKLDTSTLVCRWTVASTSQRKINFPLRGRGEGHMTLF